MGWREKFFGIWSSQDKVPMYNEERATIHNIGVDGVDDNTDENSANWEDELPNLVIPSIPNLRKCAEQSPLVNGILEDLVIKSISGYVITGSNQECVDYIIERDKEWNLKAMFHDIIRDCLVDGIKFYEKIVENNELKFRELAFDGDNYQMKELYDDNGYDVIGYSQLVLKNKKTNRGFMSKKFEDLNEEQEVYTVNFEKDDLFAPCIFRRYGKPYSIVRTVLDPAYMINLLNEMMVQIVYKQANTMVLHMGNKDRKEVNLGKDDAKKLARMVANYHKKGVIVLPFGVDAEMVGSTVLPKIQEFISVLEHQVFVGLWTPEATYSASSSNRSTAVVQLDSDKSGRVLVQEFIQEYLSRTVELEIFDKQLELAGKPTGTVWIDFTVPVEENTGAYNENGETDDTTNSNSNNNSNYYNTNTDQGLNLNNIRNTERGVTNNG